MRAARFHAAGDIRVDDVPAPGAPGPGEIVLAPRAAGICGTDLHEWQAGPIFVPRERPQILGHELAGEVLEVGAGVTHVRAGDRVSLWPIIWCGSCWYCRRGQPYWCRNVSYTGLMHPWGGMAEICSVPGYQAVPLPDGVTWEQGALIEPAAVAFASVERAGVKAGDVVLVTGAGPIGSLVALACLVAGAAEVILSEPSAGRRARAEGLGAGRVVDPAAVDVGELVRDATEGVGCDVAFECVGSAAALRTCIDAARIGGVVSQTGLHLGPCELEPETWTMKSLTIVGTIGFAASWWPRLLPLVAAGRLPVERVVTSTIALADVVEQGFRRLDTPGCDDVKIVVQP